MAAKPPSSDLSRTSSTTPSSVSRVEKRKLNTLAGRRYRQRRVDRMNDLEAMLKAVQDEREALKVKVARLEGETTVLKQLLHEHK